MIVDIEETLSVTLADADDVIKLKKYRGLITTDYLQASQIMGTIFRWVDSPSDEEIDIAIEFYVNDDTLTRAQNDINKVGYLMGKGHTLAESQAILIQAFSKFHIEEKESCVSRANSEKLNNVFLTYLTIQDAIDFQTTTKTLIDRYKDSAIMGTSEGAPISGITDFINDTGDYVLIGLSNQSYVLNTGVLADFQTAILDVLVNGNY